MNVRPFRIALVVLIVATVVCVAGVLILPQVDLPDFVLNGTKLPTASVVHAKRSSSSSIFDYWDILNPTLDFSRFAQSILGVEETDAFVAPNTVAPLRC